MTLTLLFDLDDTLLDSNIDTFIPVYFQQLATHLASQVAPEKLIQSLVTATRVMYGSSRMDRTLEQVFSEVFYPPLGYTREALAASLEKFYDEVFPTLQPLTHPRPEAVSLVEWAFSKGWKVSIATDPLFPRKAILHRLRWANLAPEKYSFDMISDFQTFHSAKVSVMYYPEFLARAGWTEGPVLMVGDSIERDVIPARQAGIPVYWLKAGDQSHPQAEGIPQGSLADLRQWLETVDISTLKPDFSSPAAMIAALKAHPAVVHTASLSLPPEQWNVRPAMDEWAFTEIVCHLRDVEIEVNLPRIDAVVCEENPFIAGQVTDPWAEERQYIRQDGQAAWAAFIDARTRLVERLESLPASAWQRKARHTIFGPTNLSELVGFMIEHDRLHAQQAWKSSHTHLI